MIKPNAMKYPIINVQDNGEVISSNVEDYKKEITFYLEGVNRDLVSDSDFLVAEDDIKQCRCIENAVKTVKKDVLSKTFSLNSLLSSLDEISGQAAELRLTLSRLSKAKKEEIKRTHIDIAVKEYQAFCHDNEIHEIEPDVRKTLTEATKGKRTTYSLEEALGIRLSSLKFDASKVVKSKSDNLDFFNKHYSDFLFLFSDLAELLYSSSKDFQAVILDRVTKYKERLEAERLEAERLGAEKLEAERLEAERLEAERLEAERLEAERLEAERLEAEKLEAERLEAERLETEKLEAEKLEAERLEDERLEAERLEDERLEDERLEDESTVTLPKYLFILMIEALEQRIEFGGDVLKFRLAIDQIKRVLES